MTLPNLLVYCENGNRKIIPKIIEDVKCWVKDSAYHRKDMPALEYADGDKEWWFNGRRHRNILQGPAVLLKDETYYFMHGQQFNVYIQENGTKEIYSFRRNANSPKLTLHSSEHCYIPAIIYSNGDVEYWYNGLRHRIDGPAVIIGNKQYWFYYGNFSKFEIKKELK